MEIKTEIYYLAKKCGSDEKMATQIQNRLLQWGKINEVSQLKKLTFEDLWSIKSHRGIGDVAFEIIIKMCFKASKPRKLRGS